MINRIRVAGLLLAVTFLLQALAGPLQYAGSIVRDEDRFVEAAGTVFEHPEIRRAVATEVTDAAFSSVEADEAVADLLPDGVQTFAVPLTRIASSQLTDAAFTVLDSDVAVEARDAALRELHGQVGAADGELTIDLRAVLVRTTRELAGPSVAVGVAELVSDSDVGRFTVAETGSTEADLVSLLRALPAISALATLAWILTFLAAIGVADDRRRTVVVGGLGIAAATVVATVLTVLGLHAIAGGLGSNELGLAVAAAISSDFIAAQSGSIAIGLALAAVGLLLGNRPAALALRRLPRHLWTRDHDATIAALRTAIGDNPAFTRLIVWVSAGLVLAGWPSPTLRVVITVIAVTLLARLGIWLLSSSSPRAARWRERTPTLAATPPVAPVDDARSHWRLNSAVALVVAFVLWPAWDTDVVRSFFVVLAFAQAALEIGPARSYAVEPATAEPVEEPAPIRQHRLAAAIAIVVVLVASVALATTGDGVAEAATGCNGHEELCDRRIDEIVFAGSHNSMSSTELGWQLAMQTGDIVAQLDHGVRALLIDTHYWADTGELDGGGGADTTAVIEAALSDDAPRPGTWLCHGFCALGATDLTAALADIALWLDANPREVLLIIVQDEISTDDTLAAFDRSGLDDLVHQHAAGTPWPTLRDLVDRNERVLVYAENQGEPGHWYQNAWAETFTESPFDFALRSDFSCDPNRGRPENPLLLVNHWVTTGIPVLEAAAAVNSSSALLERIDDCRATTGRLPTVLAVDFAQTGDLTDVVDQLNGVAP